MAEKSLDMSLDELVRRSKKKPPLPTGGGNCTNFLRPAPENFQAHRGGGNSGCFNVAPWQRFGVGESGAQWPENLQAHRDGRNPGYISAAPRQGFGRQPGWRESNGESKLFVSNLDPGVTHQDLQILFSEVGPLKRYAIHYDENGDSQGTAEVVYMRNSDAITAIQRFHRKPLDGRPINIEQVGFGRGGNTPRGHFSGRFIGRHTFGQRQGGRHNRTGGGQPSGTKRARRESVSPASLDADLEKYRQDC